jgi:hypothetical protein
MQRKAQRRGAIVGLAVMLAGVGALPAIAQPSGAAYEEAPFAGTLNVIEPVRIHREPYPDTARGETLPAGTRIGALSKARLNGQVWYRVERDGKPLGYVPGRAVRETPAPASAAPKGPDPIEMAFWDSVKDSRNPAEFRAYLDKYPNGAFAEVARLRESQLAPAPAARAPEAPPPLADPQRRQGLLAGLAAQVHDWPFDGAWQGKIRRTALNDPSERHNCPDATLEMLVAKGEVTRARLTVSGISMSFVTDDHGSALAGVSGLAKTASKFGRLSIEGVLDKEGVLNGVKVRAYDFLGTNFINYTLTGKADAKSIEGRWQASLNVCSGVFNFGRADGSALFPGR